MRMTKRHRELAKELSPILQKSDQKEIYTFFNFALWFARRYAATYEMDGTIYLVLDNSLIQAFKHRTSNLKRATHALAYTAFCRFVQNWSDRESHLALSPMAVYEHLGRRIPNSEREVNDTLIDLQHLLHGTGLRVAMLGFETSEDLFNKLKDIAEDEQYLTQLVKDIDKSNWEVDLSAPLGVKIPMSVAWRALPDQLPLRYFDDWYVHFVLSARIEQHIITQCRDAEIKPIGSGRLATTLADLNTFSRNGLLKGLGDIDLLQICDISRQYSEAPGYVLSGQTLDRDLADALSQRHVFHIHSGFNGGDPQRKERIKEMVGLMLGKPFAEEERRGKRIQEQLIDFAEILADICKTATSTPAEN